MANFSALQAQLEQATAKANDLVSQRLPLADQADFEAARRGKIADVPAGGIEGPGPRKAWDIADYDFLESECPLTVNPSLWRMGRLNSNAGLFEVADGIWQARSFDYANMTIIRGDTGWILVDPLMTRQTSAAALKVVNETLGERPVSAIIITHTHPDHFAGLRGVVADPDNPPPIHAPEGFMEYAASEGVLGGNHTSRRAVYQFGITLDTGPEGLVDAGIGKSVAKGDRTFVAPNEFVGETGAERVIDGVRVVFQMASGTEAPAEFTFLFPDHRVLCMAEVCTQTMHNVLTARGAQVRDSLLWARCIDEAVTLFADSADVLINSHNWPVWGTDNLRAYMEEQRDIYKYIHDQTLRLANMGCTPNEIANQIEEPDWLSERFHARGYYGDLKFNARAVYQRYYGFFDGHPVNLDPLPPEEMGSRFVEAVGGADAAIGIAGKAIADDDLQWAATVLSHVVFARQGGDTAQRMLALVMRHQGYRAESSVMRNFYLVGAKELEEGVKPLPGSGGRNSDLAATLEPQDWFDAYALHLNPGKALGVSLAINFAIEGQHISVTVARQVEFARVGAAHPAPDATVSISKPLLERLSSGALSIEQAREEGATVSGDSEAVNRWIALHDSFDMWFNIVTP